MNGSSSTPSGFLSGDGIGRGVTAVREVIDQLRTPSDARGTGRPDRVDVRAAVLTALDEQPGNGYQIVRRLEERGGGAPTPTAGAVYPTLQLLADEGLITAAETDGGKVWTLTAAGHAAAEAAQARPTRWESVSEPAPPAGRRGGIARSAAQLAQTVALAAQSTTGTQSGEVVAVLDDARRRILSILARS